MFDGWTFLAGLGIILFGMFLMEESIRLLAGRSLKTLVRRFTGTRVKALFTGIFTTAVLQSSSAVSLMVLASTIPADIIGFDQAEALVMLPTLTPALWVIGRFFDPANNAVLGIAAFHTLFNLVGVALFFPMIPVLVRHLQRLFSEKQTVLSRFIHYTSAQVPEAAMAALRKEILHQLVLPLDFIAHRYHLRMRLLPSVSDQSLTPLQGNRPFYYSDLERLHAEIFAFYACMQAHEIDKAEALQLEPVFHSIQSDGGSEHAGTDSRFFFPRRPCPFS